MLNFVRRQHKHTYTTLCSIQFVNEQLQKWRRRSYLELYVTNISYSVSVLRQQVLQKMQKRRTVILMLISVPNRIIMLYSRNNNRKGPWSSSCPVKALCLHQTWHRLQITWFLVPDCETVIRHSAILSDLHQSCFFLQLRLYMAINHMFSGKFML